MEYPIYKGGDAQQKVNHLLEGLTPVKARYQLGEHADRCCGYFRDGNRWIAFDNRTGDCWVEKFRTKKQCRKYLGIKKT
jgi:hypothetical protein